MYQLVETIKILNNVPQNLKWHQWRMDKSFKYLYKTPNPFHLDKIIDIPQLFSNGCIKLRFLYNQKSFKTEYSFYRKRNIKTLQLVFDNSIDYSLKYTNRNPIQSLLMKKGAQDDILIVKNGHITDSSYTNIVFFDGTDWITPSTPLLHGTARERLLQSKVIIQNLVTPKDLKDFIHFRLINAMFDFESQETIDIKNIFN